MSKMRCVQTKFWDDGYSAKLDPIEKLLFLYFLTNPLTNISGIYEIQSRRIVFDTGLSEEVIKEILTRFERDDKIYHIDDWVAIKNFIKNQNLNPSTARGVKKEIEAIPKNIWLKINKIKCLETAYRQAVTECDNIIKSNLIKYNRIEEKRGDSPSQIFSSFLLLGNKQKKVFLEKELKRDLTSEEGKEIEIFTDYWTEPNGSGTKQRWEMEKTFDLSRRIRSWFSKMNKFDNNLNNELLVIK